MKMRNKVVVLALGALLSGAQAGFADSITGLYNTGLDSSNALLTPGSVDSHYVLTVDPNGDATPAATYVTEGYPGAFPFPYWVGNTTTSQWISPQTSYTQSTYDASPAVFVFETTFTYTGSNFAAASIVGEFAVDNELVNIKLNGTTVATSAGSDGAFTGFSITSGFKSGVNTLDFVVDNYGLTGSTGDPQLYGNPTAIQVNMSSIAGASIIVPLPASVLSGSMLLGLLLAGKILNWRNAV